MSRLTIEQVAALNDLMQQRQASIVEFEYMPYGVAKVTLWGDDAERVCCVATISPAGTVREAA